jgi:hypothetical protein
MVTGGSTFNGASMPFLATSSPIERSFDSLTLNGRNMKDRDHHGLRALFSLRPFPLPLWPNG